MMEEGIAPPATSALEADDDSMKGGEQASNGSPVLSVLREVEEGGTPCTMQVASTEA